MKIFTLIIATVVLTGYSCKCSKKSTKTESAAPSVVSTAPAAGNSAPAVTPAPAATTDSATVSPEKKTTYRLVVTFYSIGEGIDGTTMEKFEKFLIDYINVITAK
mgnify:FL=1